MNVQERLCASIADQVFIARNCATSQIFASTYRIDNMNLQFTNNTFKRVNSYTDATASSNAKNGAIFLDVGINNYKLSITNNSFENYIGHAIRVQGKSGTHANSIEVKTNDFISFGYKNDGSGEFDSVDEKRAAFKIYSDDWYAPCGEGGTALTDEVKERQKNLSKTIYEGNSFSDTVKNANCLFTTNFFDVCYDKLTNETM